MSYSKSAEQTAAVAGALRELGVRLGERVLIMLPECPDFAEAFGGTIKHQAVPLPVNPLLAAPDIAATATEAGACLLLASAKQVETLTDLTTEPPILIGGPQNPWAALLRLCLLGDKSARKRVVLLPHAQIAGRCPDRAGRSSWGGPWISGTSTPC
jgi:acyl-CoA synthetase (AMP-forming)/AMP-acid ligase II